MPNAGFLLPLIGQYVPAWWRVYVPSHLYPRHAEVIGELWTAGESEGLLAPAAWRGTAEELLEDIERAERAGSQDRADYSRCELAALVLGRFAYRPEPRRPSDA